MEEIKRNAQTKKIDFKFFNNNKVIYKTENIWNLIIFLW